jgi:hypothetical protein
MAKTGNIQYGLGDIDPNGTIDSGLLGNELLAALDQRLISPERVKSEVRASIMSPEVDKETKQALVQYMPKEDKESGINWLNVIDAGLTIASFVPIPAAAIVGRVGKVGMAAYRGAKLAKMASAATKGRNATVAATRLGQQAAARTKQATDTARSLEAAHRRTMLNPTSSLVRDRAIGQAANQARRNATEAAREGAATGERIYADALKGKSWGNVGAGLKSAGGELVKGKGRGQMLTAVSASLAANTGKNALMDAVKGRAYDKEHGKGAWEKKKADAIVRANSPASPTDNVLNQADTAPNEEQQLEREIAALESQLSSLGSVATAQYN